MLIIDPPLVPRYGRTWSHLASDESLAELHAFAAAAGLPDRAFDRDHYDVPSEYHQAMVEHGAVEVSTRELVQRLRAAGLRRPKANGTEKRA